MMPWNLNVSISCEKGACTVVTLPSLVAYGVHGLNLRPTAQHLAQTILSFCGILVTWQTAHYHISFQKFSSVSLRHLLARGNFLICLTDPERTPLEIEIEIHCPIPNTISCLIQWYNGWRLFGNNIVNIVIIMIGAPKCCDNFRQRLRLQGCCTHLGVVLLSGWRKWCICRQLTFTSYLGVL